jgi:hypothetical protein
VPEKPNDEMKDLHQNVEEVPQDDEHNHQPNDDPYP